jgi:hypothetical protein
MLYEMHGEVPEIWQVQSIQPYHRPRAVFPMIVVIPGRCEDHVASLHLNAAAVHGREAPLAFDDEAHRKRRVSVCAGYLVWHD